MPLFRISPTFILWPKLPEEQYNERISKNNIEKRGYITEDVWINLSKILLTNFGK